jgi:hypothetical protein
MSSGGVCSAGLVAVLTRDVKRESRPEVKAGASWSVGLLVVVTP